MSRAIPDSNDAVDDALAKRMIQELREAHTRATSLDSITFTPVSHSLAALFEEAHKCDLAGLKIATAVLCRTVLEDSLKEIIDREGLIKRALKPGDSYIISLLKRAESLGILDGERVEIGKQIKKAGDNATHNLKDFKMRNAAKTRELVDVLRKLLEDLHAATPKSSL